MTAADRLLTEHGYDGMNMNMLAKEAAYSKATVYVYFESKDDIVRELCIERLSLLRSELKLLLKSDLERDEKFSEIEKVLTEFAKEDRVYFDFICDNVGEKADAPDSYVRLCEIVSGIIDDLTALDTVEELKKKWFAFYGRIKTEKLFDGKE